MARSPTAETMRKRTEQSLKKAAKEQNLTQKFYTDLIDTYMGFYDDLFTINDLAIIAKSDENIKIRAYTDLIAEKRRITSAMRDILIFLGLKPPDGGSKKDGGGYEAL